MARIETVKKVSFIGSWNEDVVTDDLLNDIATRAKTEKGKKMRVKVNETGVKLIHAKFLQESQIKVFPLNNVQTITHTPELSRCVMLIVSDPNKKYKIVALRCETERDADHLVDVFSDIQSKHQASSVELKKRDNGNWTLRGRSDHNANRHMHEVFSEYKQSNGDVVVTDNGETVHIPVSGTAHIPDAEPARIHVPESARIHVPESARIHVPESARIHVPESAHIHVPESAHIHVPESAYIHVPESARIHVPDPARIHVPDPARIHVPESAHIHVPESAHIYVPESAYIHVPESARIHVPDPARIHVPDPARIHVPDPARIHVPESAHIHVPEPAHIHVPEPGLVHMREAAHVPSAVVHEVYVDRNHQKEEFDKEEIKKQKKKKKVKKEGSTSSDDDGDEFVIETEVTAHPHVRAEVHPDLDDQAVHVTTTRLVNASLHDHHENEHYQAPKLSDQAILSSQPVVYAAATKSATLQQPVTLRAQSRAYGTTTTTSSAGYYTNPWAHRKVSKESSLVPMRIDAHRANVKVDQQSVLSHTSKMSRSSRIRVSELSIPTTVQRSIEDTYGRPVVVIRRGRDHIVGFRARPASYHHDLRVYQAGAGDDGLIL